MKQFPEKDRPELRPDEQRPGYHRSSKTLGHGHEDNPNRMPHPFSMEHPMDETGEGKTNDGSWSPGVGFDKSGG